MKRLLTYGLLLLTILASHFAVSACQDDLPETTDIMVTFTTRAISGGAASTAPEIEQMHDLRVIMLRSDGTIVDKGQYTPEGDFNPSSVRFTFSTTIPNPSGEDFTFIAIANEESIYEESIYEESIDEELPWSTRGIGDKLTQSEIESITVDTDINSYPIPQTDYWTVHVPQSNYKIDDRTLQFAGSKISVVFNNMTKEEQSLSNIHITGIGSASAGYLFKQTTGDDFVGTQHDASDITFTDVTNLAAGDTSEELTYYTYPVGSVSSPTLFATWNEKEYNLPITKVTDEEGNVHNFTSLARNERLKIVITLTPAGDITVNYTIAAWEETPTNIGGKAPTTPDNDYYVDNWGTGGIIDVGGGGNDVWQLGNGQTITGEEVNTGWSQEIKAGGNDILTLTLPKENEHIYELEGYYVYIEFWCQNNNGHNVFDIWFITDWGENHVLSKRNPDGTSYTWNNNHMIDVGAGNKVPNENENPYVRYMQLDKTTLDLLYNQSNSKNIIKTTTRPPEPDKDGKYQQLPIHVYITKLTLIKPTNTANL